MEKQKTLRNLELLEIDIEAGKRKIYLPSVTTVRGKKITAIELTGSPYLPSGKANALQFLFEGTFLVLHSEGKEKIKNIPVSLLAEYNRQFFPAIHLNHVIETEKSYFELSTETSLDPGTSYALGLIVCFDD